MQIVPLEYSLPYNGRIFNNTYITWFIVQSMFVVLIMRALMVVIMVIGWTQQCWG